MRQELKQQNMRSFLKPPKVLPITCNGTCFWGFSLICLERKKPVVFFFWRILYETFAEVLLPKHKYRKKRMSERRKLEIENETGNGHESLRDHSTSSLCAALTGRSNQEIEKGSKVDMMGAFST